MQRLDENDPEWVELVARTPITVCIPVFNGAKYLQDCLQSVSEQTFQDFVAIVVDNCSTDVTVAICEAYDDPRFRLTENVANIGSIGNHSRCLELIRTPYAKLLSADDVLLPKTLELQYRTLKANRLAALCTCDCIVTDDRLEPRFTHRYLRGAMKGNRAIAECADRIDNFIGGPSNTLLRMAAVGSNRFDPSYKWLADLEFHARVLLNGEYVNIDEPGFLYRRHSNTDSAVGCPLPIRVRDEWKFIQQYGTGLMPYLRFTARQIKRRLTENIR